MDCNGSFFYTGENSVRWNGTRFYPDIKNLILIGWELVAVYLCWWIYMIVHYLNMIICMTIQICDYSVEHSNAKKWVNTQNEYTSILQEQMTKNLPFLSEIVPF